MGEGKGQYIGIILISILVYVLMIKNCSPEIEATENAATNLSETSVDSTENTALINDSSLLLNSDTLSDSAKLFLKNQAMNSNYGAFAPLISGEENTFVLENEKLKVTFSSKGAQVKQVQLKEFTDFNKSPLLLIDESQELNYTFNTTGEKAIATKDLYFTAKESANSITFEAVVNSDKKMVVSYTLNPESYLVDYNVNFENFNSLFSTNTNSILLKWDYESLNHERDLKSEKQKSTAYWKVTDEDVEHIGIGKSKKELVEEATDWLSLKQLFFNTTLLNQVGSFNSIKLETKVNLDDTTNVVSAYNASIALPISSNPSSEYAMQFYFGPNDYRLLKGFDNDMEQVVELSADFFLFRWVKWINAWLIIPLFNFIETFIPNYGIIILIMTLIIKMLLMPLTFKSYVSTAKTKVLRPELEELRAKYKDDSAGYSRAQMELYSKAGVSMFGGCLPMLLQMPFLLAMFYFFPSSIELRQESFLWAQDLSTFDTVPFLTWATPIPILGNHLSVFTILMTLSSILMAKFNPQMQSQPSQPGMEMMKYMPYIFPFFLMFLFNNFPAALTYYYFLSNMITFGQQFVINKFFIDEDKLHAQIQENKKKPRKKSGFAAKMEEVYKQQQLQQEKQKKK